MAKGNGGDGSPGKAFAEAQVGLAGFTEPELESQGTDVYRIAIAQDSLLNSLAINGGQGVRLGAQHDAFRGVEVELQMLVPNPAFLQSQVGTDGASDAYRKTAGHPSGARLFAGQDLKLDHYQIRRGTWILSPG